jgi:Cu/Ag efflux protein CusF
MLIIGGLAAAEEFRGVIGKVDAGKNEMIVEGRGRTRGLSLGFALDPDTRIMIGRDKGELADLQPGDRVRLVYEIRDGKRRALTVTVQSLLRKPAGTPTEAAPAAAPAASGENSVAGSLAHIGLTEREIVVLSPGAKGEKDLETTLLVPADVKITKDQKPLKLEDLKEGEGVTVRTEKRDGKLVAATIQLGAPATTTSGSTTAMKPMPDNNRIQRMRKVLQIADWFLQQLEEQQANPKP